MRTSVLKLNTDNFWTGNFRVLNFLIFGGIQKYFYTENYRIYGTMQLVDVSTASLMEEAWQKHKYQSTLHYMYWDKYYIDNLVRASKY